MSDSTNLLLLQLKLQKKEDDYFLVTPGHTADGYPGTWQIRVPVHCGAGGSRTRVQTTNKSAFYMLSKLLIVGKSPETHIQTPPYPLNLTTASRLHCCQPEISRTP